MADGSTRPIKDVSVGDKVAATDPKAGTTGAKPVVALHLNRDTDLTDVTLSNRAAGKGATATLKTTQHHPFWDATSGSWVFAAALVVGHQLRAPDGSTETVVAVRHHSGAQDMRDLTVADTHTYYVIAGTTPVLVHNCGGKHASDEVAPDSAYVGRHRAPGTDVEPFYPRNDGFQGDPESTWLNPGDQFDRYGSEYGRFTSPAGTPMPMRALPPGTADRAYNVYEVVKPFEVQAGTIAPAFGQVGGGIQYLLPLSVRALLARGVIRPAG